MENKETFSYNLNFYMNQNGKSRKDVADAIGVSYFTFTDWARGKTYPRMDKVEMLANYFGIQKSDLIENKSQKNSPPVIELTEGEKAIIELFRKVPESNQQMVLDMIRIALKTKE